MARAGTTLACVPPRDYNARPVLTVSSRWREVPASLWHSVLTPCPPGVLKRPGRQREFILFCGKIVNGRERGGMLGFAQFSMV